MPKRWYDIDPTVSLAISMLKNSNDEMQNSVCEYTNKKFTEMNITPTDKFIMFKIFDKRWYDEKENIYTVLETLRCCSANERREISLCIINHLCNIVNT